MFQRLSILPAFLSFLHVSSLLMLNRPAVLRLSRSISPFLVVVQKPSAVSFPELLCGLEPSIYAAAFRQPLNLLPSSF